MRPSINHLNRYVSDVKIFIDFYSKALGYKVIDEGQKGNGKLYAILKINGLIEQEHQIIVKQFSRQFYLKDPDGFEIDFIQWTDKDGFYKNLEGKA